MSEDDCNLLLLRLRLEPAELADPSSFRHLIRDIGGSPYRYDVKGPVLKFWFHAELTSVEAKALIEKVVGWRASVVVVRGDEERAILNRPPMRWPDRREEDDE